MPGTDDHLAATIETLRAEEYAVTQPLPGVLHVTGRFSNPERIALAAAAEAAEDTAAVWAVTPRGDWALVGWRRPDLVTIVQKGAAPRRWRHRRLPGRMAPDAQTFLEGGSSPFDIVTRPKHRPTDAARAVLASFDIADPAPPGWEPPVEVAPEPTPAVTRSPARAPRSSTTARKPAPKKSTKRPEPDTAVCPTCFMALPATGVCDNCG